MARVAALALVLVALAVATAGCGTKKVTVTGANGQVTTSTVANIHFAKTKFVLHMGLAFGTFHRYIYKPFRSGAFSSGAHGRIRSIVKGGVAALFAVHELRMAREDALSDDRLRPLAEKVGRLLHGLTNLGASLKKGDLNPSAIIATASTVSSLGAASSGVGAAIKEVAPTL